MDVILVVGNWSSGTTAVTGYLSRLGGYTCPPTILTNDPKTPDSHESQDFRNALAATYDEFTLEQIGQVPPFVNWFKTWLPKQRLLAKQNGCDFIVLKHPLSAMLIGEISKVCKLNIVVVTRPFQDIENTRIRRNWLENYGAKGAAVIYSNAFSQMTEYGLSYISLDFKEFRKNKKIREKLVAYCEIDAETGRLSDAESWIR